MQQQSLATTWPAHSAWNALFLGLSRCPELSLASTALSCSSNLASAANSNPSSLFLSLAQSSQMRMVHVLSRSTSFYLPRNPPFTLICVPSLGPQRLRLGCPSWVGPHSPLSGVPPFGQGAHKPLSDLHEVRPLSLGPTFH
jgi:hypothetical protein